jgi:dUTP pyrophosphatase
MQKISVKFKKLHPDAVTPFYGSEEAAGFDLHSLIDLELKPNEVKVIPTGLALEIEPGYCWQFWGRSGLASKGIHPSGGLIDSDYRGELKVILNNISSQTYNIKKGERIVQVVPVPTVRVDFHESTELSETKRGQGGFGSTGK